MYRSKRPLCSAACLPYIDVVEEALCFGWIDSTLKRLPDGRLAQRLSPRRKRSHWTELNKQRCADLEARGLMTDAGRKVLAMAVPNGRQMFIKLSNPYVRGRDLYKLAFFLSYKRLPNKRICLNINNL